MDTNNDNVEIIFKYFPQLTEHQREQYAQLRAEYTEWNEKINVISRADSGNLYVRHVLHSLAIAGFLGPLNAGTSMLDLGCGGGFPGIPLAIFYPECHFHLIDRIGKKVKVAQAVSQAIGLENVTFQHGDSGECHQRFDYVVSRAVMPLDELVKASRHCIKAAPHCAGNAIPPGLVCLKGGDLKGEFARTPVKVEAEDISLFFAEPFFETKKVVYVPL